MSSVKKEGASLRTSSAPIKFHGDADGLVHGDIGFEQVHILGGDELQEAGAREAALAADPVLPVAKVLEGEPCELRVLWHVVVHADETAGAPRGAGGDETLLEHQHLDAALREVEGKAGSLHARADDDDVRSS